MGFFGYVATTAQRLFGRVPPATIVRRPAPRDASRWPQWLTSGLTISRMSAILRMADQGYLTDYFQLVQEIAAREALVTGLLSVRCAALSQRPVQFEPAKGRNVDKALAEAVAAYAQEVFDGLRLSRCVNGAPELFGGSKTLVEQLVLASYFGVRVLWLNWTVPPGSQRPRPTSIEFLDERRLWHDIQTNALYLATAQDPAKGLNLSTVDPALCIVARYPRISPHLAMAGAARAILLPWWIRFGSYKDFANYLETWSKPSLVVKKAKDTPTNQDDVENAQNMLEDFMGDSRHLLPEGWDIEVIEAVLGGEKVFESADHLTERHLQFALVGQVGAIANDVTTHASAAQSQHVRDDLTDGDAVFSGEVIEKIVSPALAIEFGPDYPKPICTFGIEQSVEARKAKALAIQAGAYPLVSLLKAGIPVNVGAFCKDILDVELREDGLVDPLWLKNMKLLSAAGVGGGSTTDPTQHNRVQPAQFSRDHAGLMIALYPSPEVQAALELDGGEPAGEIHLTLCYLGAAATYPYLQRLIALVVEWAAQHSAMVGEIQGLGIFGKPGEFVLWAAPDVHGLSAARTDLVERLARAGLLTPQEHDFTPHITLSYLETLPTPLPDVPTLPLYFNKVAIVNGGQKTWVSFGN